MGLNNRKKTEFLRVSFYFCVLWRNFSQERGFGGGRRNFCFWPLLQEFFAGIPAGPGILFLYFHRIPPDSWYGASLGGQKTRKRDIFLLFFMSDLYIFKVIIG